MNKTITQAASILLALSCLVGCGTDDSKSNAGEMYSCRHGEFIQETPNEDGSWCDIHKPFSQSETGSCIEIPMNMIEERGSSVNEVEKNCSGRCEKEISNAVFLNEVCPSGYVKKCKNNEKSPDNGLIVYFYGEKYKDKVCDDKLIDVD